MSWVRLPGSWLLSLLAAVTTWLTMSTWAAFSEEPEAYLGPLALGCALVAITGAVLRAARLHPLLVLIGQIVVVAVWLNHRLAPDPSLLAWLPTLESVRVSAEAFGTSVDAARSYAAPVPRSVPGFPPVLIVIGSFLAVLVDFLACGLRRVPLAGLPLLAMYTAPVSMLEGGVSWWKFALIALGFLSLLAAEEATRLTHWGRDLGAGASRQSSWARASNETVWPSARKIGLTATAMAVVVPIFVPTFTGGIFAGTGSGPGGDGDGIRITNPILNMKRDLERGDDVPMLQVVTPDPSPSYLRVAVLDLYDGNSWYPSDRETPISQRVDGELPAPAGLDPEVPAKRYTSEMTVDDEFDSEWLPVQYPAVEAEVPGDWRYDESTMDIVSAAEGKTIAGLQYRATSLDVDPSPDQLRSAGGVPADIFRRYTDVDDDVPTWVESLAERVTASGTSRAERAALLQDWFAKPHADPRTDPNFTYNLVRADRGSDVDVLEDFLLPEGSRTGYCEQFAGAMALMARTIEIPARIAVGFLRPTQVGGSDSETWIYSSHDLHAWPELYFDGVGWTPFEPTPSTRQGAMSPPYTAGLQPEVNPTASPTAPTPTSTSTATAQPSQGPRLPDEPGAVGAGRGQSGPPFLLGAMVALPLLLVLAALPRLARTVLRRRRWARAATPVELAEAAWAELRDSMIDLRMPWNDRATVRQRAKEIIPLFRRRPGKGEEHLARVITKNPEANAALDRIVLLVERARYARTTPPVGDVKGDVEVCVASLRIGVAANVRRKADWLPASLVNRRRGTRGDTGLALSEPSFGR